MAVSHPHVVVERGIETDALDTEDINRQDAVVVEPFDRLELVLLRGAMVRGSRRLGKSRDKYLVIPQ